MNLLVSTGTNRLLFFRERVERILKVLPSIPGLSNDKSTSQTYILAPSPTSFLTSRREMVRKTLVIENAHD